MNSAPSDWAWFLFPLDAPGVDTVSLERVVRNALERVVRCEATHDLSPLGDTLHWAHQFKAEQATEGDWPALVNARTGAPVGTGRTRAPALLMRRLEELLQSTEFTDCIARAGLAEGSVRKETVP